jgi:hypothetical protein
MSKERLTVLSEREQADDRWVISLSIIKHLVHLTVILLFMDFGDFNKQLFVNVSLMAGSCVVSPHDVPNGKEKFPKRTQ